jgi:hypothetical protein
MDIISVWISAFLTLAVFSYLYRDNPIYKFAEHLFVGVSAGYAIVQALAGTLIPNLFNPLRQALAGESPESWARIGGLILGIMILARLFSKTRWVSRWPLALMIGTFAALRMTGLAQSDLIQQVNGTMLPLYGNDLPWTAWEGHSVLNHAVLIVGVLSVLVYFFFSLEHKGPIRHTAGVGTLFLMITFGSSFGYTVLGRISLLIGRAQDLYLFSEPRYGYAAIVCAIIVIAFLIVWNWKYRREENPGDAPPPPARQG